MTTMKILFTSVGRRVELMQAFRKASERLSINLIIYGADVSEFAPALFFCDKTVMVPRISEESYIPALLDVCEKEKINALIPTIDTDLLILSQNKDRFKKIGTEVVISDSDKISICRDKRLTTSFFESCGLCCPKTCDNYTEYKDGLPAFIKPKDGSSSINAFKVQNLEELEAYAHKISDYIIQPFIEGTEYTVDAFCDFEGKPIFITPRIRLAVRSGEVLKTKIAQDETIILEMKTLINKYKPCGQITVQLIRQKDTNKDFYIEINPRFGGGAPLSIKAGADSAEALLKLINGQKLTYCPNAAKDGEVYSRFDQSIKVMS